MSNFDGFVKRLFDIAASTIGLLLTGFIIIIAALLATLDTRRNGFFTQARVGKEGKLFNVIKIRTMRENASFVTSVTTKDDPRITALGKFFRRTKIDELPQLINVFLGQMSFVGPRPDVPGYADKPSGEDRIILTVRPGITGPATLKYKNEEEILAKQSDPEKYNTEIIFPDKVKLNREYVENYSFWKDIGYIIKTVCNKNKDGSKLKAERQL